MKRLGMLRHAKSDWSDSDLRDYDRGLNDRGRRGAALMGRHIRDHGVCWDRVVASPAARVRQTIAAAAEAAGSCPPILWDERAYLAGASTLADILHELDEEIGSVLLCAHSPGLEDLLLQLSANEDDPLLLSVEEKFPTAAYAVLDLTVARWDEVGRGCGRLVHLARPRDLDPALGPEFG